MYTPSPSTDSLETRMWEDGIDDKTGFFQKCKRIASMINEDYHPQGTTEIVGDDLVVKLHPMEAVHLRFNLESLWNEYIKGLSWGWIEYMFEQRIDAI